MVICIRIAVGGVKGLDIKCLGKHIVLPRLSELEAHLLHLKGCKQNLNPCDFNADDVLCLPRNAVTVQDQATFRNKKTYWIAKPSLGWVSDGK